MKSNAIHTPEEHVAQRIRMYRTRQKMTIESLARKLHVSTATISKYENNRLTVSIPMLFDLAVALGVTVNQLVDYQNPGKPTIKKSEGKSFFQRSNIYYMYQYFAVNKRIYPCVMEVQDNPEEDFYNLILYYDIADEVNYTDAQYVYHGIMRCHDSFTNIYCRNPYNASDDIFICARNNFSIKSRTSGLLSALSESLRTPYALKVVISLHPLPMNEELRQELIIYDKDTISEIKRVNSLVVY